MGLPTMQFLRQPIRISYSRWPRTPAPLGSHPVSGDLAVLYPGSSRLVRNEATHPGPLPRSCRGANQWARPWRARSVRDREPLPVVNRLLDLIDDRHREVRTGDCGDAVVIAQHHVTADTVVAGGLARGV